MLIRGLISDIKAKRREFSETIIGNLHHYYLTYLVSLSMETIVATLLVLRAPLTCIIR